MVLDDAIVVVEVEEEEEEEAEEKRRRRPVTKGPAKPLSFPKSNQRKLAAHCRLLCEVRHQETEPASMKTKKKTLYTKYTDTAKSFSDKKTSSIILQHHST
jgi:hypothetical protein